MTLGMLRDFFLWCTIINAILLFVSFVFITCAKGFVYKLHGKMYALPEAKIASSIYKMMGMYKILIFVFNFVPYLVLVIITK